MKAESAFVMYAAAKEWEVARLIHHANGYDYIIRRTPQSKWETVQVKAAYQGKDGRKRPTREVSMRRCNEKGSRPYKDGEFDMLFVWDGMASMWLLPWDEVKEHRSTLTLGNSDHVNLTHYMVRI